MTSPYRSSAEKEDSYNVRSVNVIILTEDDKEFDFNILGDVVFDTNAGQLKIYDASIFLHNHLKKSSDNGILVINNNVIVPFN